MAQDGEAVAQATRESLSPETSLEERRLAELAAYRILDTGPDERFDRIASLASRILDMPYALITLVDRDRQWQKSRVRFPDVLTEPRHSFTRFASQNGSLTIVEDASGHDVFRHHPLVCGEPGLRAFIGAPLINKGGWRLGALGLMDVKPRTFSPEACDYVRDLAALVMDEMELHRTIQDMDDVTQAVNSNAARFRGTFENASVGIAHVALDGSFLRVNQAFCDFTGYPREEMLRKTYAELTHPDDIDPDRRDRDDLFAGRLESFGRDKRFVRKDGDVTWANIAVSLQRDAGDDEPPYTISVIQDINGRRQAEASRELLLGELNHRVKNTLAVVQGIAKQTLRAARSPEEFVDSFEARVQSMSAAHNLLNESDWAPISLRSLAEAQVAEPFWTVSERISLSGPDVLLSSNISVTLGMVIFELATNALKFGALAVPEGRVDMTWSTQTIDDKAHLTLDWRESGGPEVGVPEHAGFGMFMLGRGVELGLSGKCEKSFSSNGFAYRLTVPL